MPSTPDRERSSFTTAHPSCLAHGREDVRHDEDGDPLCGVCLDMPEDDPRATFGGCGVQGCLRCEPPDDTP